MKVICRCPLGVKCWHRRWFQKKKDQSMTKAEVRQDEADKWRPILERLSKRASAFIGCAPCSSCKPLRKAIEEAGKILKAGL